MHTKYRNKINLIKLAIHHYFNSCSESKEKYYLFYTSNPEFENPNKVRSLNYENLLTEKEIHEEIDYIWDNVPKKVFGNLCGKDHNEVNILLEEGVEDVQKSIRIQFLNEEDLKMQVQEFNKDFKNSMYKINRIYLTKRYARGSWDYLSEKFDILDSDLVREGSRFKELQFKLKSLKFKDSLNERIVDFFKYDKVGAFILGVIIALIIKNGLDWNPKSFVVGLMLFGVTFWQHLSNVKKERMKSFYKDLSKL